MKKGDARRQEILHAAEKLFYMKGYENTSVQDVLMEAGISKGGFYHHFESKVRLLEEIALARTEEGYERAEEAVTASQGSPWTSSTSCSTWAAFLRQASWTSSAS